MRICIDGPSASGKSSAGRLLARKLSFQFLGTGVLYRSIAYRIIQLGINPGDEKAVSFAAAGMRINMFPSEAGLSMVIDNMDVTNRLNTEEVGSVTSTISSYWGVRQKLLSIQKEFANNGNVILEGRDMGTVIMPDADFKFYLDASYEERGIRRYEELKRSGEPVNLAEIVTALKQRDAFDSKRGIAPLKKADDAICIDTTCMSLDEVVEHMLKCITVSGRN